jgi:hypothetical protein
VKNRCIFATNTKKPAKHEKILNEINDLQRLKTRKNATSGVA